MPRLLLALLTLLLCTAPAAAQAPPTWDLDAEWAPEAGRNPAPDLYGGMAVWRFAAADGAAAYDDLDVFGAPYPGGGSGVNGFGRNGDGAVGASPVPFVVKNTSGAARSIAGGSVPAGAVAAHPATGRYAAAGWMSRLDGPARVTATLTDLAPGSGDGVGYQLVVTDGLFPRTLASGILPDGATTTLEPAVAQIGTSDTVWVKLHAGNLGAPDVTGDLTRVDLRIAPDAGEHVPDTVAPAPKVTSPSYDHRFGAGDNAPSFRGTRGADLGDEPDVYVKLYEWTGAEWKYLQDVHEARPTATLESDNAWRWTPPRELAEGTYDLQVHQLDASGNEGVSERLRFRVDRTAPALGFTRPSYDEVFRDGAPTFHGPAGHAEDDAGVVKIQLWGWTGADWQRIGWEGELQRQGDRWSWTPPSDLPRGTYDLELTQRDLAGNVARPGRQRFRIDPKRPPSNDGRFYVSGSAEVGEQVTIMHDRGWTAPADTQYFFVWQRCSGGPDTCVRVSNEAHHQNYEVQPADRGHRLRGAVIAISASEGLSYKYTEQTGVVPQATRPPSGGRAMISGKTEKGSTLRVSATGWNGDKPIRYVGYWYRCWLTEAFCSYVGSGATHTLTSKDLGYRMRVLLLAHNDAGSDVVWSATTGFVDDDGYSKRNRVVEGAFREALGREPSSSELSTWSRRDDGHSSIVGKLRDRIKGDRGEAKAVVTRAYDKVYGHGPNDLQDQQFKDDVDDEVRKGLTYETLVGDYAEALAKQAHEKVFFFASSKWRKPSASRLAAFVSDVRAGEFREPVKTAGEPGEQLWTAVALSNDAVHGAARTRHTGHGDDDSGDPAAADREGCFGAVGPGCKGAVDQPRIIGRNENGPLKPFRRFTTLDGRDMAYIELTTAIGSIVHDAQCRIAVDGAWCKQSPENFLLSEWLAKHVMPASAEWDKAVTNVATGHTWKEVYGPYPIADAQKLVKGGAGDAITYTDDLRFSGGARPTQVSLGTVNTLSLAGLLTPNAGAAILPALIRAPYFAWGGREIRATTRLEAPAGTRLDTMDKAYCASGDFTWPVIFEGTCK